MSSQRIEVSISPAAMQSETSSQTQTSASVSHGARSGITRSASHNLSLHENSEKEHEEDNFEVSTTDGKVITIKNSGINHTLSHKGCISSTSLKLIATLFYNTSKASINPDANLPEVAREDVHYGAHVSEMAVFEFIQTVDEIMVPWKKGNPPTHKCLDSAPTPQIMEIALSRPENLQMAELRRHENLWAFENKWNVEVVLQENDVLRRYKRLIVFDMDSTLIQQEVIDEIARYVGVEDKVSVSSSSRRIPRWVMKRGSN